MKNYVPLLMFFSILLNCCHSQTTNLHDSVYYKTFPNALTVRIYSVKDYADFSFRPISNNTSLKYKSNTTLNLGAGVTYKNLSGNFSSDFGFLNRGIQDRGKTEFLDFQVHFFPQKWTSDILYQHYKGFYLSPQNYAGLVPKGYYYRPDISLNFVAISAYRLQNSRQFSFRSAFNQNEWIRKSSGTFLYGGNVSYENIASKDSSLIPSKVNDLFPNAGANKFHFISFGPGAGYAQTVVFKNHFYILGSAILNGNLNFCINESDSITNNKTSFEPGIIFKTAAGYGGSVWNVSLSWAGNLLLIQQAGLTKANNFYSGELRLTLARQISLKKPIPFLGKTLDNIFGKED